MEYTKDTKRKRVLMIYTPAVDIDTEDKCLDTSELLHSQSHSELPKEKNLEPFQPQHNNQNNHAEKTQPVSKLKHFSKNKRKEKNTSIFNPQNQPGNQPSVYSKRDSKTRRDSKASHRKHYSVAFPSILGRKKPSETNNEPLPASRQVKTPKLSEEPNYSSCQKRRLTNPNNYKFNYEARSRQRFKLNCFPLETQTVNTQNLYKSYDLDLRQKTKPRNPLSILSRLISKSKLSNYVVTPGNLLKHKVSK